MIRLRDVSFKYAEADDYALEHAACEVPTGEIVAVVGKSGVGKSTLIALLAGMYDPSDEKVEALTGSIEIGEIGPDQLRGPECASWMPSEFAFLDHLTVRQNVLLPTTIAGTSSEDEAKCDSLLRGLGIWDCRNDRVVALSGGMRTRVSLARALISRPIFLFLDEPFASLDVDNRFHAYRILCEERRHDELTTFITTHDVPEAVLLADRIIIMSRGDGLTKLDVRENRRIDFGMSRTHDLLVEARQRAPEFESLIYGGHQ